MAIFGRRRASSNPRPSTTSSSSAATLAASQAFLASRASNVNLSNAAATAALRAHTPNPTPVGQIQTKRMQRRGSLTSQTSAPVGGSFRPGGLQRRDSSGSMTERTFRSPSPGISQDHRERPASSHGPYPRHDQNDAPPVPALPKNYVLPAPKVNTSGRRPTSLEPPHRISSPPPKQADGRVTSLTREAVVVTPDSGKAKPNKASENTDDLDQIASRSPVNFSRPMSPDNALPKSPLASGRVRSPPPTMSPPVTPLPEEGQRQNIALRQNSTPATAAKKKKKKKAIAEGPVEGSEIVAKTNHDQPSHPVSEVRPEQPTLSTDSTPGLSLLEPEDSVKASSVKTTTKKKKKKTVQNGESNIGAESFGAAYPSDTDSVVSERSSTTDRPRYYNTRAAGLLAKQPSIVREDRAGEEEAEEGGQGSEPNSLVTSNGNVVADPPATSSKRGIKGRQHGRTASQQATTQAPKLDVPGVVRQASLSPGRTAHFSSQPVNEGKKHQPPGRSVSPAKSAMKSSPSRGHSPMVARGGLATSEASDSTSQYSDDGSKSSMRKKSARVSFDEEPVVVGRAASPPSIPGSPNIVSPQNKSAKTRSWIDLVQEQNQKSLDLGQDNGSAIKPTPALPSFGSVRNRESKPAEEAATQADHGNDRSKDALTKLDASTDSAIGSLIAADSSKKHPEQSGQLPVKSNPRDPLPPEVTSVEGSGYHSEDGDIFTKEAKKTETGLTGPADVLPTSEHLPPSAPLSSVVEKSTSQVPDIAVQPATPGPESAVTNRDSWLHMPGGFPSQKESDSEPTSRPGPAEHQNQAGTGSAKPEPEINTNTAGSAPPVIADQIEDINAGESEESDAGSVYSDAAEDQSDLEGDGFGSINAIVESPISPTLGPPDHSPPASPLRDGSERPIHPVPANLSEKEVSEPVSPGGWDRAQAYWSGLSQTQKQQLEQAALPGAIDEPVIRDRSMRGADAVHKKKKKKRAKKVQPQPLGDGNALQSTLTAKSLQSHGTHPQPPQATSTPHMRTSMRDDPPRSALKKINKRNSLNSPSLPEAALQKKTRPMSAAAAVDYSKTARPYSPKSGKVAAVATPASSGVPIPAQQQKHFPVAKSKMHQNDSDSDSSFKKIRPKSIDSQKYTMRRSMRSQSSQGGATRTESMAVRTASPPAANMRRAFSQPRANGTVGLRTSMRGSEDSSKQTRTSLRTSLESDKAARTKSPSRFSFLGSSKTKPAATEPTMTSGFSSRFADSSDEEDLPALTRSRFADSSDDDDGSVGLTPVRGIPRRINEGDSTELDDSSEDKEASPAKAQSIVNGNSKVQNPPASGSEGATLAKGSLRTTPGVEPLMPNIGTNVQATKLADREKKKRSFFGSLSGRKHDGSSGPPKAEHQSLASGRVLGPSSLTADPVGMPKIDTSIQTGSQTSITQNNPKSPKLQRRVTPKRITSANDISWPLSQKAADSVNTPARPSTSDGTAVPKTDPKPGPSLVLRHSVQAPTKGNGTSGIALASPDPNTKKKKKFSMLRKAFGL